MKIKAVADVIYKKIHVGVNEFFCHHSTMCSICSVLVNNYKNNIRDKVWC